ncbi:MAG: hypothetical protein WC721_06010 [Victivallaceae bacterium]|jgi:hypothetical protein
MATLSYHSQARQTWYNANSGSWILEQDKYFNELFQSGIHSGPAFPWVTSNLGQARLQQYNISYGIKYPFFLYSSYQIGQAINNGAVYTNGISVAPFDPALETAVTNYINSWFSSNSALIQYINTMQGQDEPANGGSAVFSPTVNTAHAAMLEDVNAEIQADYGFGQYGLWDPFYIPADPANDPFRRIATYRWWNSKFAAHLQNEQTLMDSLAPNNDYVAFSHNYVAEADNIDIAATCAYGDWTSADPYPSATLYHYGQPRCIYHTGFSTKLLCDLSSGKNTRIHIQCFYYCGMAPQSQDIREWTSQALKNGAKWISFWTDAQPAKVTLSAHSSPYAGPYKEALRISKILSTMNAVELPQTTKTDIIFSNQSRWGNNDSVLNSYYSVYSILGEKAGSWFRFISDTQVDNGMDLNNANHKLIYLPQIKYLRTSFGATLYNWVLGNSSNSNRLLVVFDPEAFSYDINGTSLATTTRSNILGGSLGSYKSGVSYIKTSSVEAISQEYFGVPANTKLPVTPLANMTHDKSGQVLAYNITAPSGATVLATYDDGSTAAYVRIVGAYSGKVVYFGVQPFGNSDLAVNVQRWDGFFAKMAGKASEPINLNIWKFLLPATGNDVALSFELEPGYGE